MNVFDRGWLGQDQEVVIALLMAGAGTEPVSAELIFAKTKPLNLRSHRAVEDENAVTGGSQEGFACIGADSRGVIEELVERGHRHLQAYKDIFISLYGFA